MIHPRYGNEKSIPDMATLMIHPDIPLYINYMANKFSTEPTEPEFGEC